MKTKDLETVTNYGTGSSTGFPVQPNTSAKYQTSGSFSGLGNSEFPMTQNILDVTAQASKVLTKIENEEVRKNAQNLITIISTILNNYFDISELPPLRAFQGQDGSIMFEWVFLHFRVGFSIEQNTSESGWYLVSDASAGNITASGEIMGNTGTSRIIFWLLQYVASNY